MSFNLGKLFIEWRRIVPNGVPNPSNAYHLVLLKEICLAKGMDRQVVDNVILTLEQDDEKIQWKDKDGKDRETSLDTIKQYASDIKKGDSDQNKKLAVAAADLEDKEKGGEDDEIEKKPPMKIDKNPFDKKDDSDTENQSQNISDENQKTINTFEKNAKKIGQDLNDTKKKVLGDTLDKVKTIYDDDASEDDKKEAAQWLVDNAGFSANAMPKSGQRKAYLNKLGGDRKVLGNGTKGTENLVQQVESLLGPIQEFNASGIKVGFSSAAKPDLGDENIVKPSQDDGVANYFSSHKVLQKIRPNLHGLFGVKDDNGKVKMPSSEHSKDYLAQSINNPALENTIDYAKKQIKNGTIDEGILSSLEDHQKRMQDVLNNYDIPSEEAKQAIADSYNDLMVGLHKADDEIANSIMKQLAENNLYEQELANGEEVYLPSAGNFPAGDKIKGGTLEKVSLISCKFGKAGRVYGCPANSKTICELHQNESKQNNQGQYLGEDGYTLLINDDLIKGEDKSSTVSKTENFIKDTLNEVNLGNTFTDEETSKISIIVADYMEEINRIKKEVSDSNPADVGTYWKRFSKKLEDVEDDYKKRLGDVITTEHASSLIGKNNAKNLVQKGGVKVEALMSAIEIANNIRTNESLNDLEHNKQFYDENDEPKFVTSKGTQNPDDYSITFRTKRTAGRTGGGCQLSFTGDGEPAPTQLTDDGQAIDTATGEVKGV